MSELKDLIHAETKNLDSYLSLKNQTYIVPFSQRDYEWGKAEVTRLFNDLTALYDSDGLHMLNFFTFSKDNHGNLRLFDGQQRTITCLLLLAVFAQRIYKNEDIAAALQIQGDYFTQKDNLSVSPDEDTTLRKLKFDSQTDSDFFYRITDIKFDINENIVNKEEPNKIILPQLSGNEHVLAANIVLLNNLLDEFIQENQCNNQDIKRLFKAITQKALLIEFVADTEDIALNMFESLNNTGRSLEKYYVLKNDMVKALGEDQTRQIWNPIDQDLTNYSHEKFLVATATLLGAKPDKEGHTIFIGKTTATNVLNHLYSQYDTNSPADMLALLKLLKQASTAYLKIRKPSQIENTSTAEAQDYIHLSNALALFSVTQHWAIILAMLLNQYSLSQINDVLSAVLTLAIKNFYFGEQKANTIEKAFAEFAFNIYQGKCTVTELVAKIHKESMPDEELERAIRVKKVSSTQNKKFAYILRRVYNSELQKDELEVSKKHNDIEHILPRNPATNSTWMIWFPTVDQREKYTYAVGNLTLWVDSKNRSLKNADFTEKRQIYATSGLEANRMIANQKQWGPEEISTRTKQLAKQIVAALH